MDKVFNIAFALVVVAGLTSVVAHPDTAKDVTAGGNAFVDSLKAAEGS
jgi:hypothetical protein